MQTAESGKDAKLAYLYSVHDITLVNLLRTMGFMSEYFKPDYSAMLIFELNFSTDVTDNRRAEIKVYKLLSMYSLL